MKHSIKNKPSWKNRLYTILIGMIFILPIVQQVFHAFSYPQLNENRLLRTAPTWSSFKLLPEYLSGLEGYLADTFGFRDLLIRTKNQIDLSLFSVSSKVYINSGGYLF